MFLTSSRWLLLIFEKNMVLPQLHWILRGFWGRMGKSKVVWTKRLIIAVRIFTHKHFSTAFAKSILIFLTSMFFEDFRMYKNLSGYCPGPDMNIINHSGGSFKIMISDLAHFYDCGSTCGERRKFWNMQNFILIFTLNLRLETF